METTIELIEYGSELMNTNSKFISKCIDELNKLITGDISVDLEDSWGIIAWDNLINAQIVRIFRDENNYLCVMVVEDYSDECEYELCTSLFVSEQSYLSILQEVYNQLGVE